MLKFAVALSVAAFSWTVAAHDADDHAARPTTLYLVRHAEKMSEARDPELSPAGIRRAELLAWMVQDVAFDAVYSSDFKRTRDTVARIAERCRSTITVYDPHGDVSSQLKARSQGQTLLICGHSNTIPQLLAELGVPIEEKLLDGYDDLFIVTLPGACAGQKRPAVLQRLRFGTPN